LEVRALNVSGAIALERGGIDEATYFFTRAQEQAAEDNDMTTVGRCANNLGIIANMRGDYGRAVGAYTRAVAAYQTVRHDRGMVESQHNLGITYREQGRLDDALQAADAAVRGAEVLHDQQLEAQTVAGRAEIQVARGEAGLAKREAERALEVHRALKDAVRETEDLRILAGALGLAGKTEDAEALLGQVIDRATEHDRPLLVAAARRDLAHLLARTGKGAAGKTAAMMARATFEQLGARVEIDRLDAVWGQEVQGTRAARA
jgi:tetratricopeptide (TPR) repeat protein